MTCPLWCLPSGRSARLLAAPPSPGTEPGLEDSCTAWEQSPACPEATVHRAWRGTRCQCLTSRSSSEPGRQMLVKQVRRAAGRPTGSVRSFPGGAIWAES